MLYDISFSKLLFGYPPEDGLALLLKLLRSFKTRMFPLIFFLHL